MRTSRRARFAPCSAAPITWNWRPTPRARRTGCSWRAAAPSPRGAGELYRRSGLLPQQHLAGVVLQQERISDHQSLEHLDDVAVLKALLLAADAVMVAVA